MAQYSVNGPSIILPTKPPMTKKERRKRQMQERKRGLKKKERMPDLVEVEDDTVYDGRGGWFKRQTGVLSADWLEGRRIGEFLTGKEEEYAKKNNLPTYRLFDENDRKLIDLSLFD